MATDPVLPLSGYRALDLTGELGPLCGKILADLGCDVIKMEPPGGDPARSIGPFYRDIPHPERSLSWWAFNSNKRSITLNLETADGRELFKSLVRSADFVIESFQPGSMASFGLSYEQLSALNQRVIMTSITPFGQTGPYKDWKATDIVAVALGGSMHLIGDEDRAPVRISVPQASCQAGAQAAMGTMIAHFHRRSSGVGQYVDVSMHQAMVNTLIQARQLWDFSKTLVNRGTRRQWGPIRQRNVWKCKDGYVMWIWYVSEGRGRRNMGLIDWMKEEGGAEGLDTVDWEGLKLWDLKQDQVDRWEDAWGRFIARWTKAELYQEARKRGILLFPVSDPKDIVESEQLAYRGFFQKVHHPELNATVVYPGAFVKSTEFTLTIWHRPPLIGEHNEEVFVGELGLSRQEVSSLKELGVL